MGILSLEEFDFVKEVIEAVKMPFFTEEGWTQVLEECTDKVSVVVLNHP